MNYALRSKSVAGQVTSVRFPKDLQDRLDRFVADWRVTRSSVIHASVDSFLEQHEAKVKNR